MHIKDNNSFLKKWVIITFTCLFDPLIHSKSRGVILQIRVFRSGMFNDLPKLTQKIRGGNKMWTAGGFRAHAPRRPSAYVHAPQCWCNWRQIFTFLGHDSFSIEILIVYRMIHSTTRGFMYKCHSWILEKYVWKTTICKML